MCQRTDLPPAGDEPVLGELTQQEESPGGAERHLQVPDLSPHIKISLFSNRIEEL